MEIHVDTLLALAHPGHCGDTVGGKLPPPTVPSVQHTCAVVVRERYSPAHRSVQEGGGAEETALGSRGGKGIRIKGVQRLWTPH